MSSIFTMIINGEIPSVKVHEDELTLAIMDINPIQRGQILVFPKEEIGSVWELPPLTYRALMDTVQKAGQRLEKVFTDKKKVGVIIEGLEVVDHAHVKVFPFSTVSEFHVAPSSNKPSTQELLSLAQKLAF